MPVIACTNLGLAFGTRTILEGINLSVEPGERIGVVGRNGQGKSTLLKIMAGVIKQDTGKVDVAKGAKIGYLNQDPVLTPGETLRGEAEAAFVELHRLHHDLAEIYQQMGEAQGSVLDGLMKRQSRIQEQLDAMGGYAIDHKVEAVLHGLGFTDSQFATPVEGLSGGQKSRLSLAKLLLQEPDVLLLDEPTNHLDIEGRMWLENFLSTEFKGAVVLISHDRYLLDMVVHRIIEVEQTRLIDYPGNYEAFLEIRAQRRLTQMRAFENQQTKFKSEEAYIRKYKAGQRARQARGRATKLERAKGDALERPIEMATFRLELPVAPRSGDIVLTARGVSKRYPADDGGEKVLFDGLDFTISRGERWGVIGPNGAGKSTLMRILLGEQQPDQGLIRPGSNVVTGFYRQTHEHVNHELTVVEYLQNVIKKEIPGTVMSEQQARNLAGVFLFSGDQQDRTLGTLSGGERSRAVLAGLLASAKNLIVLDEPTNHLDIPSAERLEETLAKPDEELGIEGFEGTVVLISHDRALIDSTCEHLLVLDGKGGAEVFHGTWSEWWERSKERAKAKALEEAELKAKREKAAAQAAQAQAAKAQALAQAQVKAPPKVRSKFSRFTVEQLEEKMGAVQAELEDVEMSLADPQVWKDHVRSRELGEARDELRRALEEIETEWLSRG